MYLSDSFDYECLSGIDSEFDLAVCYLFVFDETVAVCCYFVNSRIFKVCIGHIPFTCATLFGVCNECLVIIGKRKNNIILIFEYNSVFLYFEVFTVRYDTVRPIADVATVFELFDALSFVSVLRNS